MAATQSKPTASSAMSSGLSAFKNESSSASLWRLHARLDRQARQDWTREQIESALSRLGAFKSESVQPQSPSAAGGTRFSSFGASGSRQSARRSRVNLRP